MPQINVRKWGGSLVSALPQEDSAPGDFSLLENFIFDESGFPVTRGGRRKWNASAVQESAVDVRFRSLYHFRRGWFNSRLDDWIIGYAGTKILKSEQDAAWDVIYTGLESNLQVCFATLRGWLIMASDSSVQPRVTYWDGQASSMVPLKYAPYGSIVAAHAGRLWIVDRDYSSRLWYSAPFEPDGWPGQGGPVDYLSGSLAVNPGDGNAISALVPGYAGEMVIFKDGPGGGATYRLQGTTPDSFSILPLSSTIGALSQRSVSLVGDRDVFFTSRRGIHSLRRTFEHGDLESAFLDAEIAGLWRSLPDKQKRIAVAVDDFPRDTWWLFYDTNFDGMNDRGLLFNYRHQSARGNPKISTVSHGCDAASMYRDRKRGQDYLMTAQTGYSYLENMPEASDDGTEFSWQMRMTPIDAGDGITMKSWRKIWLQYDSWGQKTATAQWWGDNRAPSSASISLNQTKLPVPYSGTQILNESRLPQSFQRGQDIVHLREGGNTLSFGLSGTGGRLRLRGFRLDFEQGREDVTAGAWMPYDETRDSAVYG